MKKQIMLILVFLVVLSHLVFSLEYVGNLKTNMNPKVLTDNTGKVNTSIESEEDFDELDIINIDLSKENKKTNYTNSSQENKEKINEKEVVKELEKSFWGSINWPTVIIVVLALIIVLFVYEFFIRD